jgi:hypothetical protein
VALSGEPRERQEKCSKYSSENLKILRENPRRRYKNNINMDLKETGCEGADLLHPAQDRD